MLPNAKGASMAVGDLVTTALARPEAKGLKGKTPAATLAASSIPMRRRAMACQRPAGYAVALSPVLQDAVLRMVYSPLEA